MDQDDWRDDASYKEPEQGSSRTCLSIASKKQRNPTTSTPCSESYLLYKSTASGHGYVTLDPSLCVLTTVVTFLG